MQALTFKNFYCDSSAFLNKTLSRAFSPPLLSDKEEGILCEYVVIENLLSGVSELNLSAVNPQNALNALDKYHLKGRAVVTSTIPNIDPKRCILHIKDIIEEEGTLQDIAFKLSKEKYPILITYGRTLHEMGTIDKTYSLSPASYLESIGFLEKECYILGANYLDKDDLNLLKMHDAKIVVSPRADMFKGRGFVNFAPLKNLGLQTLFASDELPSVDILAEAMLAIGQTGNLLHDEVVTLDDLNEIWSSETDFKIEFSSDLIDAFLHKDKGKILYKGRVLDLISRRNELRKILDNL